MRQTIHRIICDGCNGTIDESEPGSSTAEYAQKCAEQDRRLAEQRIERRHENKKPTRYYHEQCRPLG